MRAICTPMRDWRDYKREHGFVRVRLPLLATDEGGRKNPVWSDYRSSWDIGNAYNGEWTINEAPLVLEDVESIAPGEEATALASSPRARFLDPGRPRSCHPCSRRTLTGR